MAGLSTADLSAPSPELDPELAPLDSKGRKRFESTADAEAEDCHRATLLRRQAGKRATLFSRRRARRLQRRLSRSQAPGSLASARHLHDLRRRIVAAVWKLVRDED